MASQKPNPDLSKRQILESIKRIVSEGESRGSEPEVSAAHEAAPAPEAGEGGVKDEDILDLVDMVDEHGDVIHLNRPALEATAVDRTSEEQVLETLRPMLQTWLDTHMPPMVERLVERELERASQRSEPE